MEIKYDLEVCTRNLRLANDQISRAYALLIANVTEGKVYGFEYKFYKDLPSRVESNILAERDITDDSIKKETELSLAEPKKDSKAYVMNADYIATNIDSEGIKTKEIIMESTDIEGKVFDMQVLSDNALSISHIIKSPILMDNKDSIGKKIDFIIKAAKDLNSHTDAEHLNHMRIFSKGNENVGYMNRIQDIALREYSNSAQIDNTAIRSELDIIKPAYTMDKMIYLKTYGSASWIDHATIYANTTQTYSYINHKYTYASVQVPNAHIDYTTVMFDGHVGIKGDKAKLKPFLKNPSREIRYNKAFSSFGERWGKFARLNNTLLYERTQMREILYARTLDFYRLGKPNVLLNNQMLYFERLGKVNTLMVEPLKSFEKWHIFGLINKTHLRFDKFERKIDIRKDYIYSDRETKPMYTPDASEVFAYGIEPLRNGLVDWDAMQPMEKVKQPFLLRNYMIKAVLPEKISIIKLYHIYEANIINKVIFADKDRKNAIFFSSMQILMADRQAHESILMVNLTEAISSEKLGTITDRVIEMLSGDVESVILVGLTSADNVESQSNIMVAKFTADMKSYIDTTVNLMAMGWGKCAHDTNIDIELIDADDATVNDSIVGEIMELATGMNKERLANAVRNYKLMERDKDKLQAIEHGFLVRMSRIPEQRPIDISKLEMAEWDTEWGKLTNITIESKDKYDKIKVPNDDYDYSQLISKVYDEATGIPRKPKGPINNAEVEVNLPIVHYNAKYNNLVREEIPVDLYIYKDMMLLIWIFWCRNRAFSENILNTLKEYYETENIEMTMFQEYAKIAQMDAIKAIDYVLDKVKVWIEDTISYYDAERMDQYERVMKQARWFGEKIANELAKYILVREYESSSVDITKIFTESKYYTDNVSITATGHIVSNEEPGRVYLLNHTQPIDGELIVECIIQGNGTLRILLDDEEKTSALIPGIYLESNPSSSPFINPAIKIELPAGSHDVKMILEGFPGNAEIISVKVTNTVFKNATMRFEAKPGTGTQAIDKLLSMMYDYYEIHHLDKAKGERNLWLSE